MAAGMRKCGACGSDLIHDHEMTSGTITINDETRVITYCVGDCSEYVDTVWRESQPLITRVSPKHQRSGVESRS